MATTGKYKKRNSFFRFARILLKVLNGQVLTENGTGRLVPFILYLTLTGILYIANTHYAEKTVREIDRVSAELKELKSEYISTKSELMFHSKQSAVAGAVLPLGIRESIEPPKKIIVQRTRQ